METKNPESPGRIELASYSAGTVILRLTPGEESVALVFNILSQEMMRVPKELLSRREYKDRVIEMQGEYAIVSFDQRAGLGTPFGKEEPEDGKNRRKTTERETLEETGNPVSERIIESVSYTEQPNRWEMYSNTVFLANGIGFQFNRSRMRDPNVNPKFSRFYPLLDLPFYRKIDGRRVSKNKQTNKPVIGVGTYQAAFRRIIATLLQLDRELLTELDRPNAENADDLVRAIVAKMPFRNVYSPRMIKMFIGQKREDVLLARLEDQKNQINRIDIARLVGKNIVLWLSGDTLEQGLNLLLNRAHQDILHGPEGLESYLGECIARKESSFTATATDKRLAEMVEDFLDREPVEADADDEEDDYTRMWLRLDEAETPKKTPKPITLQGGDEMIKATTPTFFACIGASRACGKAARAGELTCAEHTDERTVALPAKVLIRMHFSAASGFGQTIVEELMREGVPFFERTKTRQEELELRRMMTTGIRVFGDEDLGPNVIVNPATNEMESTGYVLTNVHVLSLDEIMKERDSDKVGSRTVVFLYEYGGAAIPLTETAAMLLGEPFMSCRVWVNLVDFAGTQIHAVELTAYQHGHPAHHELCFAQSVWAFKEIPRPEKLRKPKA